MKQFQISHTQYIDSPENKQLQQKEEKHFDEELFLFDLNKIKGICYLSLPLPPRCEKPTSFIYFYTALNPVESIYMCFIYECDKMSSLILTYLF